MFGYLNRLVDQCNNTYHRSVDKKPPDTDYSALAEEIESIHKAPTFKLVIESGLLSARIFLAKAAPKIDQEKYVLLILH